MKDWQNGNFPENTDFFFFFFFRNTFLNICSPGFKPLTELLVTQSDDHRVMEETEILFTKIYAIKRKASFDFDVNHSAFQLKQWSLIVLKCLFAISQWQWYLQTIVNNVIFNQAVIHITKIYVDGILQVWQPCGRLMPTIVFSTRLVFCSYCESDPWRRVGARV